MMLQKKNTAQILALFVFTVLLFSDKLREYQITWTARRGYSKFFHQFIHNS